MVLWAWHKNTNFNFIPYLGNFMSSKLQMSLKFWLSRLARSHLKLVEHPPFTQRYLRHFCMCPENMNTTSLMVFMLRRFEWRQVSYRSKNTFSEILTLASNMRHLWWCKNCENNPIRCLKHLSVLWNLDFVRKRLCLAVGGHKQCQVSYKFNVK